MSPQPTRLNVFKNDQDTWDYTNPNLGGPGKGIKHPLSICFVAREPNIKVPLLLLWEVSPTFFIDNATKYISIMSNMLI